MHYEQEEQLASYLDVLGSERLHCGMTNGRIYHHDWNDHLPTTPFKRGLLEIEIKSSEFEYNSRTRHLG
jgi:hypothetical protein